MKIAKALGIFTGTFLLGCYASYWYALDTPEYRRELMDEIQVAQKSVVTAESAPVRWTRVSDETKITIVAATLKRLSPTDHPVNDRAELYLDLDDAVFAGLPKKINGVKLRQLTTNALKDDFKSSYTYFTDWKTDDNRVSVTSVTQFYGGNMGGCNYVFAYAQGKWIEQSCRCFAVAS